MLSLAGLGHPGRAARTEGRDDHEAVGPLALLEGGELGGGARIFESARAWDAFTRDYAERSAAQPPWVQQLLDRHFAMAYARALLRAKRNTPPRAAP